MQLGIVIIFRYCRRIDGDGDGDAVTANIMHLQFQF